MSTPKSTSGPGCFFYGCVVLLVLVFLAVVAGFFGIRYGVRLAIDQYTDSAPQKFAPVSMSSEAKADLDARILAFKTALSNGQNSATLTLTSDEINSFMSTDDDLKKVRDRLRISIEKDAIKAHVSLPLDDVGVDRLKGRYLNGAATLKVVLTNDHLFASIESVEVKGKALPANLLGGLRGQNLAEGAFNDPGSTNLMNKVDTIEVKDSRLTIRIKPAETNTNSPAEP